MRWEVAGGDRRDRWVLRLPPPSSPSSSPASSPCSSSASPPTSTLTRPPPRPASRGPLPSPSASAMTAPSRSSRWRTCTSATAPPRGAGTWRRRWAARAAPTSTPRGSCGGSSRPRGPTSSPSPETIYLGAVHLMQLSHYSKQLALQSSIKYHGLPF